MRPDGADAVYRKRFLHAGEGAFVSPGEPRTYCPGVVDQRVFLAICADTVRAEQPRGAWEAGATVYAAGVLWGGAVSKVGVHTH